MKKLITYLIFIASIYGYGQNNLVFDQVLLIELNLSTPVIVPVGKVWKIEGYNQGGTNLSGNINLDGAPFYLQALNLGANGPVWLPAGSELRKDNSGGSNVFNVDKISVLQFSVSSGGTGGAGGSSNNGSEGMSFSGVINEVYSFVPDQGQAIAGTLVVPADKVYKVTYASAVTLLGSGEIRSVPASSSIFVGLNDVTSSTEGLYLSSGSYEVFYNGASSGTNANRITISAIEYSIN